MAKELEVGQDSKLKISVRDIIAGVVFIVSLIGIYYSLNLRISILEERDRVRDKDFTEMKNKVDKIYDVVIKLDK